MDVGWAAVESEGGCRALNRGEPFAFGINGAGVVVRMGEDGSPSISVFQQPVPVVREDFGRRTIPSNEDVQVQVAFGQVKINVGSRSKEIVNLNPQPLPSPVR